MIDRGVDQELIISCPLDELESSLAKSKQTIYRRLHLERHGWASSDYPGRCQQTSMHFSHSRRAFFFCFRQPSQPLPEGTPGIARRRNRYGRSSNA